MVKSLKKYKVVNRFTGETVQTFMFLMAATDTALAMNAINNMEATNNVNPFVVDVI